MKKTLVKHSPGTSNKVFLYVNEITNYNTNCVSSVMNGCCSNTNCSPCKAC